MDKLPIQLRKNDFTDLHNGDILCLVGAKGKVYKAKQSKNILVEIISTYWQHLAFHQFTIRTSVDFDNSKDTEDIGDPTQIDLDEFISSQKRKHPDDDSVGMIVTTSPSKKPRLDTGKAGLSSFNSMVMLNPNELQNMKKIGFGSSGEVYEAIWRGTRVAGIPPSKL